MCLSHGYIPKFLNLHKLLAQKVGAADSDSVAGKPISTQSEVKVQSTSLFIFSSCNSFLHSPRHLLLSAIDLVLFSMFSTGGGTEKDRDEGSKRLIERRDKVDTEQSVCECAPVINVSNKKRRCGSGGERSCTHMSRGNEGLYYCDLLVVNMCVCACMFLVSSCYWPDVFVCARVQH